MATDRKRSSYFTPAELEVLMQAYSEYEHIFRRKSNTAAAAKEREMAWEKITARVNTSNPTGERRTWKQIKMKHKNIIQNANRKKAEARKMGGGQLVDELTLQPVAEGIAEGSSSELSVTPQDTNTYIKLVDGVVCLVQPPTSVKLEDPASEEEVNDDDYNEETVSAALKSDPERPAESMARYHEDGPSTSTTQHETLPVKELHRIHLMRTIAKTEKEMVYLDRKIRKTDLEILLLERQLRE